MGLISEFGKTKISPGGPKIVPNNGRKWPRMLQNGSKSSFVVPMDPNGTNYLENYSNWYGGIQHDLLEPMTGVGCQQNWF